MTPMAATSAPVPTERLSAGDPAQAAGGRPSQVSQGLAPTQVAVLVGLLALVLVLAGAAALLIDFRLQLSRMTHQWATVPGASATAGGNQLDALWTQVMWIVAVLLLAGGVAVGIALRHVGRLREAVRSTVRHADGLLMGRIEPLPDPPLDELRPLVAGVNLLIGRLGTVYAASAEQVELLRQQAQQDPLTGLLNRQHFMACLERAIGAGSRLNRSSLLIVRVVDLKQLDRRAGREQADCVLRSVAQSLSAYAQRVPHCLAGRLNGADFALLLPVGEMAHDTAHVLAKALQVPLSMIEPGAQVAIGAAELVHPVLPGHALALADEALAQSEADRPFSVVVASQPTKRAPRGECEWRVIIAEALEECRVALEPHPVHTPDGRLLHLECSVQLQLSDGTASTDTRWLAFAERSQLRPRVDERAIQLALEAITLDGQRRSVSVAGQSLASVDFHANVLRWLEASPQAASRLWIDVSERMVAEHSNQVLDAVRRWKPHGVSVGLVHVGDGWTQLPQLVGMGLDFVRVDARTLRGSEPERQQRFVQGLVKLVQSAGLTVIAQPVPECADLELLWSLGFDAAAGDAARQADLALAA